MRNIFGQVFMCGVVAALIYGCDSAPEQATDKTAEPAGLESVVREGFFSDLPRFVDVTGIRQIGVEAGRTQAALERLNMRHDMIIGHHQNRIKGAKILDFGSYDGRWTYAAIKAGADHVTGIEINDEFVAQATQNLEELGVSSDKYDFIVSDLLAALKDIEPGEYDGAICAGIYYHITYHVELMDELKRLDLDWVIMDTSVVVSDKPIVQWSLSPYGLEGTPSVSAVELIATEAGLEYEHVPLEENASLGMWDYNAGNRVTMTLF